jgi:glycosyltransferase involved in cell wall biosynthesis
MSLRERTVRALQSLRREPSAAPRLSVIVPAFNVEDYLAESVESILAQSYRDLEIVVVDDGSTDGTAAVARDYADRLANVRVVTTANRGLGAARNLGIQHARGELIAFVDSDDTVLPEAYDSMVGVLDESGSDFVVGGFTRNFDVGPPSMPPRQRHLHGQRRIGVHIDDFPRALGDVFAWNKVFRREFWERAEMAFPEGTRYEDQPALTRAYLLAKSFDVLKRPVYFWRIRDEGTSITQGRRELDDVRDRFQTKRDSLALVKEYGSAQVLRMFYLDGLTMDMPVYFRHIPDCDDEYWRLLHTQMRDLWDGAPSFAEATIPVAHRLICWLVANDRRQQAEVVVAFAERHRPIEVPVDDRGDHMVAKLPYWDDPSSGIPPEMFCLQEHERAVRLERADGATPDRSAT